MKALKQRLAKARAARKREIFWRNFRAARRCERGFSLVVVGYLPTYQLAYKRDLKWRIINSIAHLCPPIRGLLR